MLDALEYRRRGGVAVQSGRLGFVIEDDFGRERRLSLSQSFGVHVDFNEGELVICWSSSSGLPSRRTGTEATIRRKDDAFAPTW